ncbi:unnamed protein product [Chrysoparadoxa australica]
MDSDIVTMMSGTKAPSNASGASKSILVRCMKSSHTGGLRRRTKFTRAWRSEPDLFEIRSNLLLLYKVKNGGGLLEALFSEASSGDVSGAKKQFKSMGTAPWDSIYELSGATVECQTSGDKSGTYPFKVHFASNAGAGLPAQDKDLPRQLHLSADSEKAREGWVAAIERAASRSSRMDFALGKLVGRGQWGKVFLVRKTGGPIAYRPKEHVAATGGDASGELLALKEVQLTGNTNIYHVQNERLIMQIVPPHTFIVGMQYAFRMGRYLYYGLDFMNGGDLFRHWRRHRDRRGEMAPFYASEVLLALEHLHRHGVIYRDLKPENVLLDAVGHIKLADLGLAKLLPDDGRTSSFCGTEAYLAPEMVLRLPYDYSVDIWQFGCFLFEMYAGRSPFWLPRKPRKFIRENILNGTLTFPSSVPEIAKPVISALLQVSETQRLGCSKEGWQDIKADPYFAEINWDKLLMKEATPPILPEDPGPNLVNNFDEDFTEQEAKWGVEPEMDEVPNYDEELLGFGFVREEME